MNKLDNCGPFLFLKNGWQSTSKSEYRIFLRVVFISGGWVIGLFLWAVIAILEIIEKYKYEK